MSKIEKLVKVFEEQMEEGRYHSVIDAMFFTVVSHVTKDHVTIDLKGNETLRNRQFKRNAEKWLEKIHDVRGGDMVLFTVAYRSHGFHCIDVTDIFRNGEEIEFVTTDEAAEILGKSKRTISNYLNQGKLEGIKEDGQWKIKKVSVETMKEDN